MKTVFAIFALVAVASALPIDRVIQRVSAGPEGSRPAVEKSMIEKINNANLGWKADTNSRFLDMSLNDAKKLMGVIPKDKASMVLPPKFPTFSNAQLPANYSVVEKFRETCPSVTMIKDQGGCGSCWAVSASSSMQDRWCVNHPNPSPSNAVVLSASEIMSCCSGFRCLGCSGCNGGQLAPTWHFAEKYGIVPGGPYGDTKTCAPYTIPPCSHHVPGKYPACKEGGSTPRCPTTCVNGQDWNSQRHYFQRGYSLPTIEGAKEDILAHGSIQAAFTVHQSFLTYKSGVYQCDDSPVVGGHAVSVVGWGTTAGGQDYWLVRNSWRETWGDGGYFKIDPNSCGISDDLHAGIPNYSKSG